MIRMVSDKNNRYESVLDVANDAIRRNRCILSVETMIGGNGEYKVTTRARILHSLKFVDRDSCGVFFESSLEQVGVIDQCDDTRDHRVVEESDVNPIHVDRRLERREDRKGLTWAQKEATQERQASDSSPTLCQALLFFFGRSANFPMLLPFIFL